MNHLKKLQYLITIKHPNMIENFVIHSQCIRHSFI